MNDTKKRPQQKPHWYIIVTEECVVCGHTHTAKIRRYDEKPKDPARRFDYQQFAHPHHFI
jgi:UDP-2,3-diacylglucosamine pyrophosphatase LpxH